METLNFFQLSARQYVVGVAYPALRRFAASAIMLAIIGASAVPDVHAQRTANRLLGAEYRLPDSLYESYSGERHQMSISRSTTVPYERELVRIAERVLPDSGVYKGLSLTPEWRREFERAASGIAQAVPFSRPAEPRVAGALGERWWLFDFDGTFTPLALTSGAVSYYMARFRDIVQGRGQFRQLGDDRPDRTEFSYRAIVMSTSDHDAHRVVELSMSWSYWCSELCGMAFSYRRRVYFDIEGRVVHVEGDGPANVSVS